MANRPIPYQPPGDVVRVGTWLNDDEFPVHPKGSQPKRTLICPLEGAPAYLIPGHTYIFKSAKAPWQARQLWSEVIAYRMGARTGLDVPPCFVAVDEMRAKPGVLMESFLGYPDEVKKWRLVHGSDVVERFITDKKRSRPHGVRTNIQVCRRAWQIKDAAEWWGKVLAFDAIIGNTDRHPENWGLLLRTGEDGSLITIMAPVFDNATSLGYEISDGKLVNFSNRSRMDKYIDQGRHDCGWDSQEDGPTPHAELCARFASAYPPAVPAMRNVIRLSQSAATEILHECTCFDVSVPFSAHRARFVFALIERRKEQLSAVLGE